MRYGTCGPILTYDIQFAWNNYDNNTIELVRYRNCGLILKRNNKLAATT